MQVSQELKTKIRAIRQDILHTKDEEDKAQRHSREKNMEAGRIWQQMNFRERYLCGRFGGDVKKVTRYRTASALADQFNQTVASLKSKRINLGASIDKTVDSHLRAEDTNYQALLEPHAAALAMKSATDAFLQKISTALSEIRDAQLMETFDAFTKKDTTGGKTFAFLSAIENGQAATAIEDVKKAAPGFQKAVADYTEALNSLSLPSLKTQVGDTLDLVTDFAFDGFDFMSFYTLFKLSNAKKEMKDLDKKVREFSQIVDTHLKKAKSSVDSYAHQAYLECVKT